MHRLRRQYLMRALIISSVFPSPLRPTFGVFVKERVRHVAAHCEVVVVAPVPWFPFNRWLRGSERAEAPPAATEDGITVLRPRFFSLPGIGKSLDGVLYFLSLLPFVARLRRRFPFDLIDAHFAYPDGVAAVLLAKAFGRPVLITLRGDEVRLARYPLRRWQMALALRAARMISVSDSLRRVAEQLGIDRERVRVIPNGVDGTRFRPLDRAAARAALALPRDRRILLSVGALIERKGHHRVLEILPELVARRPDLLLVIVGGDGAGDSCRAQIETLIRSGRLEQNVMMVPPRPHDQIPQWMAAADLFCLATRSEGWCNALMEALACGLPVVTTRVGGNPEFVRNGRDGLLVPYWDGRAFGDALLQALDLPWDQPAIAARAQANGWEHVAIQVLEEFHLAVASSAAASPAGV